MPSVNSRVRPATNSPQLFETNVGIPFRQIMMEAAPRSSLNTSMPSRPAIFLR
ncbi:hypothetical protein GA0061098_104527 [Bradyrhizobium shewense]|uniref:Uncharacterized protein n=1 Tax=Bradyrhizobium shewense TaxID=1761772 RepID=A0A1C3XTI9_9BRAD|nr:hypothetical protein GA0061098_104527 [Bradyrhizobium shewense]